MTNEQGLQGCAHPLHQSERERDKEREREKKRAREKEREKEGGREKEGRRERVKKRGEREVEYVFQLSRIFIFKSNDRRLGTF
jgi:hypothetical protein